MNEKQIKRDKARNNSHNTSKGSQKKGLCNWKC